MPNVTYVISVPLVPADAMAALTLRAALAEMCAKDPTLGVTVGPVNEIILWGQSELQMDGAVDILKRGKGLSFTCGAPQVQYCKTITRAIQWEYTHKRQRFGFYTTRFVDAPDEAEAERLAIAALRQDERLRGQVLNDKSDPPMLFAEEIAALSPRDGIEQAAPGLVFYEDRPTAH